MLAASLVPPLMPDELLAGYFERWARLCRLHETRALPKTALGAPWRRLDLTLPTHLQAFADALDGYVPELVVENIILGHTLYPYYAAALSEVRRTALWNRMLRPGRGPIAAHRRLPGIDQFYLVRRYCTECLARDKRKFGFAYLHRTSMLPFVSRCPFHQIMFVEKRDALLVESSAASKTGARLNSQQFDAMSVALLHGRPTTSTPRPRIQFENCLKRAGWLTEEGRLSLSPLVHHIGRVFSGGFESSDLCRQVESDAAIARWVKPAFQSRGTIHPVHLVLLLCMFRNAPPEGPDCMRPTAAREAALRVTRRIEVAALKALDSGKTLGDAAKAAGISITTLATIARRKGVAFAARPKRLHEKVRLQISEYLAMGESVHAVCEKFNISIVSAYRIVRESETVTARRAACLLERERDKRRAKWCEVLRANPTSGQKSLRVIDPSTYAWLYRNDRDWLDERKPAKKAKLASKRSRNDLAQEAEIGVIRLNETANTLLQQKGRPLRLSAKRLTRLAGIPETLHERLLGRPSYRQVIEKRVDTAAEFVRRRLRWARDELIRERQSTKDWSVNRRSGLRQSTIRAGTSGTAPRQAKSD